MSEIPKHPWDELYRSDDGEQLKQKCYEAGQRFARELNARVLESIGMQPQQQTDCIVCGSAANRKLCDYCYTLSSGYGVYIGNQQVVLQFDGAQGESDLTTAINVLKELNARYRAKLASETQ